MKLRQRQVFWFRARLKQVDAWIEFGFHPRPHNEEVLACWMIILFATQQFLDEYCEFYDGCWHVKLGIDLGKLDEHGGWKLVNDEIVYVDRKEGHCCASLVALALKAEGFVLAEYPAIQSMLDFVHDDDMGEERITGFHHDLAHVLKYRYDLPIRTKSGERIPIDTPEHYSYVVEWALQGLDARWNDLNWERDLFTIEHLACMMDRKLVQTNRREHWMWSRQDWFEFGQSALVQAQVEHQRAYREFSQQAIVVTTHDYDGKELRLARWATRNHQAGAASRSHHCHVFMQEHPEDSSLAGGVMISRDRRRKFDLRPCAFQFNILEQEIEGRAPQFTEREQLVREGFGYPNGVWYFFHGGRASDTNEVPPGEILGNRFLTAPETPATEVNPDVLWEALLWTARNPSSLPSLVTA